jgi:hypothetical protein
MSCPYTQDLGAFALGIDPSDRAGLERHVADCQLCQTELSGLTAVTALLAKVREHGIDVADAEPPAFPDDLLDRILGTIAAERAAASNAAEHRAAAGRAARRRRGRWLAAAAAAVVIGSAGGLALAGWPGQDGQPGPPVAASRYGVEATTSLHPDPRGTRIQMSLSNLPDVRSCRLVAKARDGRTETITSWPAGYDTTVDVTATTSIQADDLAELQVIDDRGRRLLTVASPGYKP